MNEQDIRKYANLMQELGLSALEVKEDNKLVRLERTISSTQKEVIQLSSQGVPSESLSAPQSLDYISVKSPIVGVFYAAPAENAEPFVSVGDVVQRGKTLCIIEAMKLMNEIIAEEGGTIVEICVQNGQVVEFGTELFRIKR